MADPTYTMDTSILPVLAELKACLCAELPEDTCFCQIVVGDAIPFEPGENDTCCVGGYVKLSNAFPSTIFPLVDQEATCVTTMAFTISVGILRCAPMGYDGNPPTQEEMGEYAQRLLADMAIVRRVVRCCLGTNKFPDLDQWVGAWTPIPYMETGIGGGELQVIIGELT